MPISLNGSGPVTGITSGVGPVAATVQASTSGTSIDFTGIPSLVITCGVKTLSGTLDRVRITTANCTDAFDAGIINILYE